jgi:hypothetical protein
MDDEEQSRVLAMTYCGLTPLSIHAGILVYRKWIEKHQTGLFKRDAVLDLIDIGLLRVPDEPLSVIVKVVIHIPNVYTLYGRRQVIHPIERNLHELCGSLVQQLHPTLNFPQFGRILYMQTNLSAALCEIRVAERGVGLQPTFSLE